MIDPLTPRHRAEPLLACAAAACWLAAWFLPVMEGYAGWQAFHAALTGPFRDQISTSTGEAVPQILSALTNLAFVAMFLAWWRRRITLPTIVLKIAIACLLINFYWLVLAWRAGDSGALLIGYYVWLAAFALLTAVTALNAASARRTSKTPTAGTPA